MKAPTNKMILNTLNEMLKSEKDKKKIKRIKNQIEFIKKNKFNKSLKVEKAIDVERDISKRQRNQTRDNF